MKQPSAKEFDYTICAKCIKNSQKQHVQELKDQKAKMIRAIDELSLHDDDECGRHGYFCDACKLKKEFEELK